VLTLAAVNTLGIEVDIATAVLLSLLAAVCACGASGVAGGSLLLNPLALALLPGAWQLLRGRLPGRAFGALLWTLAGIAALSLPLHWLSLQAQFNMQWIVLLLPVHLALALVLGRRGLAPVPG